MFSPKSTLKPSSFVFRRPLLKLSGEVLGGEEGAGFHEPVLESLAETISNLVVQGISPSIVLGGGNFFRGARGHLKSLKRHHGDFIGMLATIMNAVCFSDYLLASGVKNTVFSAMEIPKVCSSYQIDKAIGQIEDKSVCLFAGGSGNPFFSTDTAAALRAIETNCDVLIKVTKVDGVYDSDPISNPKAKKFQKISYGEVLKRGLGVMDLAAIALCRENKMPLLVLSMMEKNAILKACQGKPIGTRVVED
ncbi:UMP kinase [bacterium]|nr:UMP kinase [bacterium]